MRLIMPVSKNDERLISLEDERDLPDYALALYSLPPCNITRMFK